MASLMFVTMDGGGNVPPLLEIAVACQARGHNVIVHGHGRLAEQFHRRGLRFQPFGRARAWDATQRQSTLDWVRMFNDRGMASEIGDAVEQHKPDLAIVDCMLIGVHHVLADAGVPRVVLTHTVRAYLDGLWRIGVGTASRVYQHDVGKLWDTAALNVVAGYPPLDRMSASRQPTNVRWTGAITGPATVAALDGRPHVLVSLSTNRFRGMRSTLQRIIDALGKLPVRATVTTGGVYSADEFAAPEDIRIVPYVDHAEIMGSSSLVIGHGGYSTTVRALAHGLPLLLLPVNPISDQPLVARAVTRLGAGRHLSRHASARKIAREAHALITNPGYRLSAGRIGAEIRATDGAVVATKVITDLADGL